MEDVELRSGETANLTLVMDPAKCVRGRVLDCDRAPARYVSVELRGLDPFGARNWFTPLMNEDGSFAMLLEGEYEARAFARRGPPGPARRVRRGDPPVDLTVCCDLERKITVRVLHEGTPVGGAGVRCFNVTSRAYLSPPGRPAHTGSDGSLEYRGFDPGSFRAVLTASGPDFVFARSVEVDVPPAGLDQEILIESIPGEDLELRLKRSSGRPAGDLPVFLRSEASIPIEIEGSTDDEGVLRLPRLPPGDYLVEAGTDGFAGATFIRTRFSWGREDGPVEIEILDP